MSRISKRDRVLAVSQTNSATALTKAQLLEASKRPIQRTMNTDPLSSQQSIIQNRIKELKEDLPHLYGFPWYAWARKFFESRNRMNFLVAGNQLSKAVCLSEWVPTPNGMRKMSDISVGEHVFGRDGRPTKVVAVPYYGVEDAYEVVFNDHSRVVVSGDHEWICKGPRERFIKQYTSGSRSKEKPGKKFPNKTYGVWVERTTNEIIAQSKYAPTTTNPRKFCIPVTEPVAHGGGEVFDPYLVGMYIGNGCERTISYNILDTDMHGHCAKYPGVRVIIKDGKATIRITPLYAKLVGLGLDKISYEKEIPDEYMSADIESRKSLLAGLMDTDGTVSETGQTYSYSSTSERLSEQVLELVCSLGGIGQIVKRKAGYKKDGVYIPCRDSYTVTIWTDFNPFISARKSARWRPNTRYRHERVIESIRPVGKRKMKCITVANDDGSFLVTRDYIVTHNSSTAIRKNIEWACNKKLWPELWDSVPKIFWYFYPSETVAAVEFEKKWVPEFLPRGAMKNDANYGWDVEYCNGTLEALHFKSGVTIYFKSYGQKVVNLQTSTVHMITGDEELPSAYLDELLARLRSTRGYFNLVFTATMGLQIYYRTMECIGTDDEAFKTAFKQSVSMYDCTHYEDGTPSKWTPERIAEAEAQCTSKKEVLKRIHGRFVRDEGLRYEPFDPDKNVTEATSVPGNWRYYSAVDIGSGGKGRSAGAIVFLAVSPDFTRARVVRTWRGDNEETTAADILRKYRELRGNLPITQAGYDYASREFGLIAARSGEGFIRADKTRTTGEATLNTLFKSGALTIDAGVYHNQKLATELMSVPGGEQKNRAFQDDLCFSGNTLIYTSRGVVPIRCVMPGDMVLNRFGWKKVLRTSSRWGETFVFALNRKRIACTESHKFFSDGEFQAIGNLTSTQGMLTQSFWGYVCLLYQYQLSSMASRIAATPRVASGTFASTTGQVVATGDKEKVRFIGIFGFTTTALFRKVTSYITRTRIHLTTAWIILNVLMSASIRQTMLWIDMLTQSIKEKVMSYWPKSDLLQKSGTLLRQAMSGIELTENLYGTMLSKLQQFANFAALNSRLGLTWSPGHTSAHRTVGTRIDGGRVSIMKPGNALYVGRISQPTNTPRSRTARVLASTKLAGVKELVYNLAVEDNPEYYASGFLVSNCDALKYASALVPWDFAKISPGGEDYIMEENRDEVPEAHWTEQEHLAWEIRQRRGEADPSRQQEGWREFEQEIDEWNAMYGS